MRNYLTKTCFFIIFIALFFVFSLNLLTNLNTKKFTANENNYTQKSINKMDNTALNMSSIKENNLNINNNSMSKTIYQSTKNIEKTNKFRKNNTIENDKIVNTNLKIFSKNNTKINKNFNKTTLKQENFEIQNTNLSGLNYSPASSGTIVIDSENNDILYEFNKDKRLPMASTTKIVTAITVIENFNIKNQITIPKQAVGIEGSSIYLREGDIYTAEDLLYGLMLRSGNDSAVALALAVGGSVENFANLMNQTAKKVGAFNSNFMNPHGLHNENHYTTPYDLALITSYAMKNQDFRRIVGTKNHTIINHKDDTKQLLVNKNKMLTNFKGANGVKTGYTLNAGRCLVSSAKRGDFELICVTLNCRPMWEKSSEIFEKIFNNYEKLKLIEKDKEIMKIELGKNKTKYGVACRKDFNILIKKADRGNLKMNIDVQNTLKNVKIGENIGKIEITLNNKLIFSEKIYTI